MLNRVREEFKLRPERLIADTAYESVPMLGWLVDEKFASHIQLIDKAGRTDGTWSRADFEWDAENNQYICPEGEALKQFRRNYSDPSRGPTGKGVAKFQALKHTCQACPSKLKCCTNADARKITRVEHEDARDVARAIAKTPQYRVSVKLRKKVEMLFAHLKRILGLGRLRLHGSCSANDEFLLAATAKNLRKLAKIFPAPQQPLKARSEWSARPVQNSTFCARNTLFFHTIGQNQTFASSALTKAIGPVRGSHLPRILRPIGALDRYGDPRYTVTQVRKLTGDE